VKIGQFTYSVRPWPAHEAIADGSFGECDPINLTIRIRDDLPPQWMIQTLMHEISHGIWTALLMHLLPPNEENNVSAFSAGMTGLMVDNPQLFQWMLEMGGLGRQAS
jgi:hypothetical protein